MKLRHLVSLFGFVSIGLVAAEPQSQEKPIPRAPAKQELPDGDRDFLRDAAAAEWRLREISSIANEKVKSSNARDLARAFQRRNDSLSDVENLAKSRNLVLPPRDQKIRADWVRKGNFGDAAYVDAMVDELRAAVRIYEKGTRSADREIAELANRRLPELRKRFEAAHREQLDTIDRSRRRG